MIFWGQFSFFGILGVKNSNTEKFYNIWVFSFQQKIFLRLLKFFSFWSFDPQNDKKRKLAPENQVKMSLEFKTQKLQGN